MRVTTMMKLIKTYGSLLLLGVVIGILVFSVAPAIRFFFRGFYLLLENPLEAFCFFFILTFFMSIWIWLEERESKV